jgi:hypothetical protein
MGGRSGLDMIPARFYTYLSENMKKTNDQKNKKKKAVVSVVEIKNEPTDSEAAKKGYNEKNPLQPQGAFTPDSLEKDDPNDPAKA